MSMMPFSGQFAPRTPSEHALLPVCSVCRKFCGQDFLPRVAEVFFRALAHRARLLSCPPGGIFVVGQDDFALNFSDQVLRRTKTRRISRMGKLLTHLTSVGDLGFSQCCSAWRSSPACTRLHPPAPFHSSPLMGCSPVVGSVSGKKKIFFVPLLSFL